MLINRIEYIPLLSCYIACPEAFIFSDLPSRLQAELPCSQLDSSFLPGGMVTARCSGNSTWGPMDMSQCTYRSDIPVAAVVVVEITTDSDIETKEIEVRQAYNNPLSDISITILY